MGWLSKMLGRKAAADPSAAPAPGETAFLPKTSVRTLNDILANDDKLAAAVGGDSYWGYLDEVERDAQVTTTMGRIRRAMAKGYWSVAADERTPDAAVELADEWLKSLDRRALCTGALDAFARGFVVFEAVWKLADRWTIDRLLARDQRYFAFDEAGALRYRLDLMRYAWPYAAAAEPRKWILAQNDVRHGSPYGKSAYSLLYYTSFFRRHGKRFWAVAVEMFSAPQRLATMGGLVNDNTKAIVEAWVSDVYVNTGIVVPEGVKLELLAQAKSVDFSSYANFLSYLDREIAKLILGSTLGVEGSDGGKGTQALGTIHQNAIDDAARDQAEHLERILNTALAWMTEVNFGGSAVAPRVQIDIGVDRADEDDRQNLRLAHELGVPIPVSHAREVLSIPAPADDDELLPPKSAPSEPQNGGDDDDPRGAAQRFAAMSAEERRIEAALEAAEAESVAQRDRWEAAAWNAATPVLAEYANELWTALGASWPTMPTLPREKSLAERIKTPLFERRLLARLHGAWRIDREREAEVTVTDKAARDGSPAIHAAEKPQYDLPPAEAIKWFRARVTMSQAQFDAASDFERAQAFRFAAAADEEIARKVKAKLDQALERGTSLADFEREYNETMRKAGLRPWPKGTPEALRESYAETVFRNNLMSAANKGRAARLDEPEMREYFPLRRVVTAGDGRVRPEHAALEGVYPADECPTPPFGHRCRCGIVAVSEARMKRRDGMSGWSRKSRPENPFDPGFSANREIGPTTHDLPCGGHDDTHQANWNDLERFGTGQAARPKED